MLKIKRDDEVIILAGKDKGKRGKVRQVLDNDKLEHRPARARAGRQSPTPRQGLPVASSKRKLLYRVPTWRYSTPPAARLIV